MISLFGAAGGYDGFRSDGVVTFEGLGDAKLEFFSGSAVDATVQGAVAAVEIVAGRVARQFSEARVIGPRVAAQTLTPIVLATIGRSLIERGESLHWLDVGRAGDSILLPAEPYWDIQGGANPNTWWIRAEISGPTAINTIQQPRAAWLHVLSSIDPVCPSRGVSALRRAHISSEAARIAEDALRRELRMPAKAVIPQARGIKQDDINRLRAEFEKRADQLMMPITTQSGPSTQPQTDWKVHRLTPEPSDGLVKAAAETQGRVIALLGGHPALAGGASASGAPSREARKQLMDVLVRPLGAIVSAAASMLFESPVSLMWDAQDDVRLVRARTFSEMIKNGAPGDVAAKIAGMDEWADQLASLTPEPPKPPSNDG